MKNKNKNKEWGLSHPVIGGDLLRSLCLNLGWDFSAFAPTIHIQMFLYLSPGQVSRWEFYYTRAIPKSFGYYKIGIFRLYI